MPLMRPRPDATVSPDMPSDTGAQPAVPDPDELYPLSFAAEELALSDVLKSAVEGNIDLRSSAIDIAITEKQITAALGAYDEFVAAGVTASKAVTPQRGSAAAFTVGNQSLSGNFGFERKLESGGTLNFTVTTTRSTILQPMRSVQGWKT